jgi:hypothetical protein
MMKFIYASLKSNEQDVRTKMKLISSRLLRLTVILSLLISSIDGGAISDNRNHSRAIQKRSLFYPSLLYPYNACTGILVAIAIPLTLPNRNVFVSYNFEANYNMANQPSDAFPGPLVRLNLVPLDTRIKAGDVSPDDVIVQRSMNKAIEIDDEETTESVESSTTEAIHKRNIEEAIMLTRKGVYRILESRLNS